MIMLLKVSQLNSEIVSIKASTLYSSKVSAIESQTRALLQNFSDKLEMKLFSAIENETMMFNAELENKLAGLHSSFLAVPCAAILQFAPFSPPGHYWIRSSNGSAVRVYCDMTRSGTLEGG